ncbi:MAG: YtxH domain-containing protein [Ignavibacteriae bacterium]|nr:YtxH domain-containing protein [Ignavibacteriota bacterium]MCB9214846.1 YtxH domain-containing protein [Ignavibacteria bacterium]
MSEQKGRERTKKGKAGKVVGILGTIGAAAAAWYFLDPKSGKYRRKKFVKRAKKAYGEAEYQVRRLSEEASKGLTTAVDKTSELARQGVEKVTDVSQSAVESAKRIADKAKAKNNR